MNPSLSGGSSIVIHPSQTSIYLFEILQGKYSYVKGQTLYSSLRNSGVFFRQLFIHLYQHALNNCTYDGVVSDWKKFETSIKSRWDHQNTSTFTFKQSTFKSWATTIKMTLNQVLLHNIHQTLHTQNNLLYERYIDWVVTLGVVPVARQPPNMELMNRIKAVFSEAHEKNSKHDLTIKKIMMSLEHELISIVQSLTSIYIPDYSEVTIEFLENVNVYKGIYKNKKIDIKIITRPIFFQDSITFDSPVQRLFYTIMTCYRTTEHAKLCQLLNTAPVKSIIGTSGGNVYSDIMTHLEESSQKSDPKKELMQLLIKLAEHKTVSGVTDVVEDFITDVSQNIVDKNKLFGKTSETTTQGLKKQVSNSIFKCLTKQINEQFDTINNLEKEREVYLKNIHLIESQLHKCQQPVSQNPLDLKFNLLTSDTFKTLDNIHTTSLNMMASSIPKGESVLNSFFSQYVPPFRELNKDLTILWENEIFQTYKLHPVVDNQGQRLYVKYSQDTISNLLGPFTYTVVGLSQVALITDVYSDMSSCDIAEYLYKFSRLAVYITDIESKYCPLSEELSSPHHKKPNNGVCLQVSSGIQKTTADAN